jgi:hypothetical protein
MFVYQDILMNQCEHDVLAHTKVVLTCLQMDDLPCSSV